jgi:phosphoribosylglycinamide formyltransferase 1
MPKLQPERRRVYSIAVLISGNGSNLQAIIDAITHQKLPARISLVLSDRETAFGLERAQKAGIPTRILNPQNYSSKEEFDHALKTALVDCAPDLIVLAGFMRILGKQVVEHFKGRLINIHPALLPAYKGLNTHQRVLTAQEKIHGTTVHFITESLDDGPIIAQAKLAIQPDDTPEHLKQRVQELEHIIYPLVIRWFAEKKLTWLTDGIYLEGKKIPESGVDIQVN